MKKSSETGIKLRLSYAFDIEKFRLRSQWCRIAAAVVSALITAGALPGIGLPGVLAWFGLAPFVIALRGTGWIAAGLLGWLWGSVYGWTGFAWLREIHPAAGIGIGPIYGAYWILFALWVRLLWRYVMVSGEARDGGFHREEIMPRPASPLRECCFTLAAAAGFALVEFLRWNVLPWNALGVTQWHTLLIRNLAAQTGLPGITFLIAAVNAGLAAAFAEAFRRRWKYAVSGGVITAAALLAAGVAAALPSWLAGAPASGREIAVGVLQPNPPLRRIGMSSAERLRQDAAAINFNVEATGAILKHGPDLMIWPETSVGTPFRGDSLLAGRYRDRVSAMLGEYPGTSLLLGTVDWLVPLHNIPVPGLTNSALLLESGSGGEMVMSGRYDKQHLVPFGEYVPFRKWLPEAVTERINMGDDLTPGKNREPMKWRVPIGINICFEDIFDGISREFALRGAEMLVVITNDSWYPESSEQFQHLANSVFRSVETGLPMVRCGSNSGSVLIHPDGGIESLPGLDPFKPASAAGIFRVVPGRAAGVRLYLRWGHWWIMLCRFIVVAAAAYCFLQWRRDRGKLLLAAEDSAVELNN